MNQFDNLQSVLESLNKNIVKLTNALRENIDIEKGKQSKKKPYIKYESLSDVERVQLKNQFDLFYNNWLTGKEFDVKKQLEEYELKNLRKLVDAANISQDRKASKEKLLRLIITRFREMKMLTEGFDKNK
jgi:hypothetical protein